MGGYDLVVSLGGERDARLVIETKIDNVDETLWDLFKVIAAQSAVGIEDGYLLVAASERIWQSRGDCVELFNPSDGSRSWDSIELFDRWRAAWQHLLEGGSARPVGVPSHIQTRFLGQAPIPAYPGYALRCIGARATEDAGWIEFEDDWPKQDPPPLER